MAIRKLLGKRRGATLIAATCVALGIGSTIAVQQATASGSTPTIPKASTPSVPTFRPTSPTGQAVPAVTATNAQCGQLVTASLTLNGNLFCSGTSDGLTVGGTSVVLNLNGFQIFGGAVNPGGIGVKVIGKSATVENGEISDFQYGVQAQGTSDTVTKLRVSFNFWGIYDAGSTDKVTSNEVFSNQGYGIVEVGSGTTLSGNHVATNGVGGGGYFGMYVGGTKDIVSSNIVTGTQGASGMYVGGFNDTLTSNIANFNQGDGIVVYDGNVIDGGGNLAKGNDTVPAGSVPEQCFNIVCN